MPKNLIKFISAKFIGIIFLLIGVYLFKAFPTSNLFFLIVKILLMYFAFYHAAMFLIYDLIQKNKIADYIFSTILAFPVKFVYMYQHYSAPFTAFIMFGLLYFVPSFLVINLKIQSDFIYNNSLSIMYILNLISIIIFAYKSNKVMNISIMSFDVRFLKKHLIKFTDQKTTRYYTYLFMTTIYVIFNILNFSSLNFTSLDVLNSIKEVFVTFVAIDTLLQIRKHKRNSSN